MAKPLSVLIVGDGESNLKLILHLLKGAGYKPAFELVKTATQLRTVIRKQDWQVMVSSDSLPKLKNITALQVLQNSGLDIPFIVVSDKMGEEAALELLKAGACDVLQKDTWGRLGSVVARELRHVEERQQAREVEADLRNTEEKWRSLVSATPDYVALHNQGGMYLYLNHYARGFKEKDVIGSSLYKYMPAESVGLFRGYWEKALKSGTTQHFEFTGLGDGGHWRVYDQYLVPMRGKNQQVEVLAVARDITLRKEAEEALRESEDKFKYVFDHSLIGKSITLPSGEINVNQAFGKMLGYSRRELNHRKWQEITHPEDIELTQRAIDQLVSGEVESIHITKRFIHKNGFVVWVELSSAVRRDRDGKPVYFISSLIDITRRKQTEEALQSLSTRQEAILAAVPDILMEVNQDKVYTWANKSGLEFFGEGVIGKKADFYFEGEQDIYEAVSPLFQGSKEVIYVESWQRRKDGEKRLLAWWCRSLKDKDGIVRGALSSAHDITEGKLVEQALKKSEEKFRLAYMTGLDAFYWSTLEDGKILEVNPVFEDVFGYPREEAIGRTSLELRLWHNPADRAKMLSDLTTKGRVRDLELRARKKDGKLITISYSASMMEMDNKRYILGSIRDITERKQTQILQEAVYRISAAAETTRTLEELYPQIHQIISSVMPAENFYITLYDEAENLLRFPYFKDAADEPFMGGIQPGRGLTAYILRTGKSLLCTQAVHDELERQGEVKLLGVASAIWLGVPLIVEGKTIGAMVVQHYTDPNAYTEREQHMLEFVSTQVAIAIRRKRAEQELRESEERFRSLYENATIGIYRTSPDGRILMANPALVSMLGYESFEGLSRRNLESEGYEPGYPRLEFQKRIEKEGEVLGLESAWTRMDGSIIHVRESAHLLRDENNRPLYYEGTVEDITERKQVERQREVLYQVLRAVSGQLELELIAHSAVETIVRLTGYPHVCIALPDENGTHWAVRGAAGRLAAELGSTYPIHKGVIGNAFKTGKTQWVRDVLKDPHYVNDVKALGGPALRSEFVALMRAGNDLLGALNVESDRVNEFDDADVMMIQSAADILSLAFQNARLYREAQQEISERKLAEEALRQSEAELRALFASMHDAVMVIDREGVYRKIAPTNPELLIKPPEELVGKLLHDFFPPEQANNFINVIRKVMETKQPAKVEYDLPIGDRTMQFETTISPLTEDTSLWVAHDITARKQAEEQILSLNAQLEQRVEERTRELRQAQDKIVRQEKLAVLGQLAGGVGHELRNPLGIISNAIYYLKNIRPDADEKVKQYYGMIEHEVHTSEKIITDLLDFARLESMERGPVSVPELVNRTMTRFQVPENIKITLNLPKNLPRVHADMGQMELVLGNLSVNACQAMAKGGGRLTISARRVKLTPGSPSEPDKEPGPQKGTVAISLKDTGMGITPENLKLIFEPLFTTKSKGIGLGLAVSRKLAEANGGWIEVESEVGKGSTFTLYLPVEDK